MSTPILQVTSSMRPSWVSAHCREGSTSAPQLPGTVHAVAVLRDPAELAGEPELAACGAIVVVDTAPWRSGTGQQPSCPSCLGLTGSVRRSG